MSDGCQKEQLNEKLDLLKTEEAIFFIKQKFQAFLAGKLKLTKVSAPLFVDRSSGVQDNLNGVERPVSFSISAIENADFEVVQSLAKWKRFALARYNIPLGRGIYTDMNALRPDEETLESKIHSVYVDQWDWELAIQAKNRNTKTLHSTVKKIYQVVKKVEAEVENEYKIPAVLPENITFFHSEELATKYPYLTPRQREHVITKEYGAVFIIGVGNQLADGLPHDGRAPDYDDWSTPGEEGRPGLNGDILFWNPVLRNALEISSMGIRVDKKSMLRQLKLRGCMDRTDFPWHKMLLLGDLPESIGGGIGQSRLCMFLLRKRHIGEVQVSIWPESVKSECKALGINLL